MAMYAWRMFGQSSPKTSLNRRRYSGTKASRASIMSSSPLPATAPRAAERAWDSSDLEAPAQKSLP